MPHRWGVVAFMEAYNYMPHHCGVVAFLEAYNYMPLRGGVVASIHSPYPTVVLLYLDSIPMP